MNALPVVASVKPTSRRDWRRLTLTVNGSPVWVDWCVLTGKVVTW